MLGKFFGKKKAIVKKMVNKDLAEAVVAVCVGTGYASGGMDDEELQTMMNVLEASPALEGMTDIINPTIARLTKAYAAGPLVGNLQVMRELKDCQHSPEEAEEIMVAGMTIASADGDIDADETAFLKKAAGALGTNLSAFGL